MADATTSNKVIFWAKLFDGVLFINNSHLGCGRSARYVSGYDGDGFGDGVDCNGAGDGSGAGPHYNYGSPLG